MFPIYLQECAQVLSHSLYIFHKEPDFPVLFVKVFLNNRLSGFLKVFNVFLWTLAAFSVIVSPVLVLAIFREVVFFFKPLTLTYDLLKHHKGTYSPKDEPLLCLRVIDNLAKNQFTIFVIL